MRNILKFNGKDILFFDQNIVCKVTTEKSISKGVRVLIDDSINTRNFQFRFFTKNTNNTEGQKTDNQLLSVKFEEIKQNEKLMEKIVKELTPVYVVNTDYVFPYKVEKTVFTKQIKMANNVSVEVRIPYNYETKVTLNTNIKDSCVKLLEKYESGCTKLDIHLDLIITETIKSLEKTAPYYDKLSDKVYVWNKEELRKLSQEYVEFGKTLENEINNRLQKEMDYLYFNDVKSWCDIPSVIDDYINYDHLADVKAEREKHEITINGEKNILEADYDVAVDRIKDTYNNEKQLIEDAINYNKHQAYSELDARLERESDEYKNNFILLLRTLEAMLKDNEQRTNMITDILSVLFNKQELDKESIDSFLNEFLRRNQ